MCKTDPDLIQVVRFGPNAFGPEASQCARIIGSGSGRTQPACYQLPTFRLRCVLPQMAQITLCKPSLDPIWFYMTCQVLAKWIQSGSKPVCKNHPAQFWPTLLSRSESDADQIWHVYWGILPCCVQHSGSVMSSTWPACATKVQNMS